MAKYTYCFTKPTEMHGILAQSSWAKDSMRRAINLGTGPWFCYFVNGKFKATAEMSGFLVKLGFQYAYEFAKSEEDSATLARAAFKYRSGAWSRDKLDSILTDLQQKYARRFESKPLMVAARLANENPCSVASAICVDGLDVPYATVTNSVLDYARKVFR